MSVYDTIIIGGGMAGASCGYFLAESQRVLVLERESQPGYHSTGRSAAVYSQTYGNAVIRAITGAGRAFFEAPPPGFAEHDLLSPRGAMFIGHAEQVDALDHYADECQAIVDSVHRITAEEARRHVPVLRPEYVAGGVLEPEAMDIDVHALHQGFLRGLRARGGTVTSDAEVRGLRLGNDGWHVETNAGAYQAQVVINAAGAWCDVLAGLADARPVDLVPKRRTAITFAAPAGVDVDAWPICIDIDEQFYFKPDAGRMLASPADETPIEPCDVQPEELDIALTVDRVERAAELQIRHIEHRWAGLRSFVADKTPVVGFDPDIEGFFWLAGQGGYGIQTAPTMGRLAAALAQSQPLPADLQDLGVSEAALSPGRFR